MNRSVIGTWIRTARRWVRARRDQNGGHPVRQMGRTGPLPLDQDGEKAARAEGEEGTRRGW